MQVVPATSRSPVNGDRNRPYAYQSVSDIETDVPPSASDEELLKEQPEEPEDVYRRVILVTVPMFMGYAILVVFQHNLKKAYGMKDNSDSRSHEFNVAVSMLYIGNLIFRMAHNFIFAPIKPRSRVYVAIGSMMVSMLILIILVFELKKTHTLAWVYLAYGFGGVGVGSFESNVLSAITPLGHDTKVWAIVGFPIGFATTSIGGFALQALGTPVVAVYYIVLGGLGLAILVFALAVPVRTVKSNAQTFDAFIANLKCWREWMPQLRWYAAALLIDMFMVSMFSSIMLYIFDGHHVPMFGANDKHHLLTTDVFFVIYNSCTMLGDSISRKVAYRIEPKHPFLYLILSLVGGAICLSKLAILAPIGIFLIMYCNGSVYATSTRFIDSHIPKQFNLISLSFWLFIGDFGSVTGSNLVPYVRDWVCTHKQHYICT